MDSLVLIFKTWALGLLLLLALQYLVFLYAYRKKRIDIIDVFWGPSFILVCCLYLIINIPNLNIATFVAFLCITIWGSRLTVHIFVRFKSRYDQDERYTNITRPFINNPFLVYIKVFAVQAFLASLVTIVLLAAVLSPKYNYALVVSGFIIWLFGFIFELVSDAQLKSHVAVQAGELIKTGLWKYSRHPNYFGELVQWWAIWLMLSGGKFAIIGLVGPLSISILILFVSGIPPLEKHMADKEGWTEYKKSTSLIIPWLGSLHRSNREL